MRTFASLSNMSMTLNFDLSRCEGYRNFCNKLWNATRFVLMNVEAGRVGAARKSLSFVDQWLLGRLQSPNATSPRPATTVSTLPRKAL